MRHECCPASSKIARAEKAAAIAPWRIGVDVGGTFTDLVMADSRGELFTFKAPTDVVHPAAGVMAAVRLAADGLELSVSDLLVNCRVFVHGSTIATNTILERKGAVVGLLTTEGFRDALGNSGAAFAMTPGIIARRFRTCWCRVVCACR